MKESKKNYLCEVVIPAYNAEKYLDETLQSIFNQRTSFSFSVHLSDDCSTDDTIKICQKYQEEYSNFRVTAQKVNIGMVKNQHFVITNSFTKYVAYMDADDSFIDMEHLQKQVDFLEKNQDVTCVFSNAKIFTEGEEGFSPKFSNDKLPPEKFDVEFFITGGFTFINATMVFRQEYNKTIPDFFLDYFQYDWLLHLHHALNGKLGYNNYFSAKYRIHATNAMSVMAERKFLDGIRLEYKLREFLPNHLSSYFRHATHHIHGLALFYLNNRKIFRFLKYYFLYIKFKGVRNLNFRDEFWLIRKNIFKN